MLIKINQRFWLLLALIGVVTLMILPSEHFSAYPLEINHCLHYKLFGFQCPGCGFTRGVHALVHYNISKALALNPAVLFSFPILLLEFLLIRFNNKSLKNLKICIYYLFVSTLAAVYLDRIYQTFIINQFH